MIGLFIQAKPLATCFALTVLLAAWQTPVAQSVSQFKAGQEIPSSGSSDETYRLGPGDVLEIRVFNRPQLTREALRIDENGLIRMPLIAGPIQASCRTSTELANEIASKYLKFIRSPQVDVFIKEYQSQPVAVVGAVNAPGRFQLHRSMRLLDLLTFAGGPSDKGGRQVQLIHSAGVVGCPSGDQPSTDASGDGDESFVAFDLSDTLKGDAKANPYVRPGDVITVPEAEQAFVVGNVVRPMTIPLKEATTISQAIAMAGGTMPDTKSDRIRLVRHTPEGKKEIFVDLKAINSRRSEDVALQANDIVEVPVSGGKRFLRTLSGAIVPHAARLPVRVIP